MGVCTPTAIPLNVRITPCGVTLSLGIRRDIQAHTSQTSVPILRRLVVTVRVDFPGLVMWLD